MALEIKAISGGHGANPQPSAAMPIGTKKRPNQQGCCPQPFRHRSCGQTHQALADLTTDRAVHQDDGVV